MKKAYSLFVLLFLNVQFASSQINNTVAGGNGQGSALNQLSAGGDISIDAAGNIYIADADNNRIQKWAPGATEGVTVAGGNGQGSAANQLNSPGTVCLDAMGNIYVNDRNNYRVQKFVPGSTDGITVIGGMWSDIFVDGSGVIYASERIFFSVIKYNPATNEGTVVAGRNGSGTAPNQLGSPAKIFVDAAGNVYVVDLGIFGNYTRVQKWAPGATAGITVAGGSSVPRGSAANQLNGAGGIYVDSIDNVYIADAGNHRIQKWAPGAIEGVTAAGGFGGGPGASQLNLPSDIIVDASGNMYVADFGNYRIQKLSPRASSVPPNGITIANYSPDVAVDKDFNVYLIEPSGDRILKFPPGATTGITVAGGNGYGSAANQFANPQGVFVDNAGNIYVADSRNFRIQKWAPGASAGTTVAGGNGFGSADNQMYEPYDVFVDKAGNVYVPDVQNNRIQKWVPGASAGITVADGHVGELGAHVIGKHLFVDTTGNIYVSSTGSIQKWAPGATVGVIVAGGNGPGSTANEISPGGFFIDAHLNIYVADSRNNRIQKWTAGALGGVTVAGGNGQGSEANQLNSPNSVFLDANGNIYVSADVVKKFEADYGLGYKYYEGNWNALPDFNSLTPVKTGRSFNTDISARTPGGNDNFAFVWERKIIIPTPGTYTFETISDDGSNFYFNTTYFPGAVPTVNNDGLHAGKSATGSVDIPLAGVYPVAITFFENSGDETMQLYWTGPGIPRQRIPDAAFASSLGEDNIAPGNPSNLRVTSKGGNFITLDWDDATDNVGVIAYDVYVGGAYRYSSHESPFTAGGLLPNSSYSFAVKARDLGLNVSGFSNTVVETTLGTTNGLTYKYYEGAFDALPDFNTLTPVATGTSLNVDLGVRPPGRNDNFAFFWEGYINITTPGMYTFETVSDDGSKIYFNTPYNPSAYPIVSNDGLHPPTPATGNVYIGLAGVYPISITFFEKDGGEQMQVYWTGPGIERQLIPNSAFLQTPPPPQNGLTYKYYEGAWNSLPDFKALAPLKTGSSDNIDIGVRTPGRNDNFGFVWEGYINVPAPGDYTFETISDDGSKLYFNSLYDPTAIATVNNDGLHAPYPATGTVNIPVAGIYPISMTFFEKDGGEQMQVYWSGPGINRQLIPNSAFFKMTPVNSLQPITAVLPDNQNTDLFKTNLGNSRIYPNPFNQTFNIDFYNSSAANDIQVGIYDLKGRLVYLQHTGKVQQGNNTLKVNLDRSQLVSGVYMAQLKINNVSSKMFKLVKMQ